MTVVFNTLLTANDQPLAGKSIRLVLVSPGFVDDQQAEIVRTAYATTDATGRYEFADVEPNATIDPANTYYLVHEPGLSVPWAIVVPDSGTAQWVKGLLVDPPPAGPLVVSGSVGPKGDKGDTGVAGQGVPTGGTTGQVLAKVDGTDFNTHWSSVTAPVASVNGHTGTVVLTASDVGADVSGAAATAQSAAVAAAGTYTDGKISAEVSRANTAYDTAGAAAAAQTAAAADATSKVAAEATARTSAIATQHTTDLSLFDAAGAAATAQAAAISAAATDATTKVAGEATARTSAIATQHTADVAAFDATGAASSAQAFAIQRANHTGTQSADSLVDGTTNKAFLATERTKLAGIATGATANSSDAVLEARANHTGTQTASTVSDFDTQVRTSRLDQLAAPTAAVAFNAQKATGLAVGTALTDGVSLAQLAGFRKVISGRYYGAVGGVPGTTAQGTNVLTVIPLWLPAALTVSAISCEVTTLAASSTVRLGIYSADATTDMPATVLLDAGTVDSTTTGVKEITGLSTVLAPGLYWLAAVPQGGNPTLRTIGNSAATPVAPNAFIGSVATGGMNCYFWTAQSGALATWAGSSTGGTAGTKVMVKAA